MNVSRYEPIRTVITNNSGANMLASTYTGIVFAFDMDDYGKYIIYGYFKNYLNNEGSVAAKTTVLASNGLTLGPSNAVGTQVINGGTNVKQYLLGMCD